MRFEYILGSNLILLGVCTYSWNRGTFVWWQFILVLLYVLGYYDYFQKKHSIRRNFPLLGRLRYIFELIRPEINQYFIESNTDGRPFSREERSVVYARSKLELDNLPFGTQTDIYRIGYEWANHSIQPIHVDPDSLKLTIGGPQCKQPYEASIVNISAMSYGSLSANAIRALNGGAKLGGFAHNTGEGGFSPYHKEGGGDIIWQIGTGYFGTRTPDGKFDPDKFAQVSKLDQVKMIEIKLSQGAKPGHGGILPGAKVTKEIATIRGVPMGKDVISPPAHSTFSTPKGLLEFIQQLRELSNYKPIGFKLCIGKRREFLAICKAMDKYGIYPDFITVDGGEGGTGAAPLEFSNNVGAPSVESVIFVHNALVGFGLRKHIKIISSGHMVTGFNIVKRIAVGADAVNLARPMMMALGCIQALRCNSNACPTGVATSNPHLSAGLVPRVKAHRVYNYHKETVESVADLIGTMGLSTTTELRPWHILRRVDQAEIRNYSEIFEYLDENSLKSGGFVSPSFSRALDKASADSFR